VALSKWITKKNDKRKLLAYLSPRRKVTHQKFPPNNSKLIDESKIPLLEKKNLRRKEKRKEKQNFERKITKKLKTLNRNKEFIDFNVINVCYC